MNKTPDFDIDAAHQYFSAHCFNSAWDLMDKTTRTAEEDRMMVALNQASIYHWRHRPDCTDTHLSVGYWQASRIQALLKNSMEAARYAEICLAHSRDLEPFYLGYAYEAQARAAMIAGEDTLSAEYRRQAGQQADLVADEDSRTLLMNDLEALSQADGT